MITQTNGPLMNHPNDVELDIPKASSLSSEYIDYYPGDLNIILSAPHGGRLKPASIPNRDAGAWIDGEVVYDHSSTSTKDFNNLGVRVIADSNTIQLTLLLAKELHALTEKWPSIVINQLYRGKMDANCDMDKATFNVPEAKVAWLCFHRCIEDAKSRMSGPGLFLDIHGQSHPENWIELGYTVTGEALDSRDYDTSSMSISSLATTSSISCHELISGSTSLGAFLEDEGYSVVPGPSNPGPNGRNYYTGGYNTIQHGSKRGGFVDAIQVECPRSLREKTNLPRFSQSLARAVKQFWSKHYN